MSTECKRSYEVNATITGTPSVNATIVGTPSVNATIVGTPTVQPANTQKVTTNSTLGAGGVYTSASFDISNARRIIGTCLADQNGTLEVYQSWDDTNYDGMDPYTYAANTKLGLSIPVVAKYAKIVFTNGGVAQGTFRLTGGISTL